VVSQDIPSGLFVWLDELNLDTVKRLGVAEINLATGVGEWLVAHELDALLGEVLHVLLEIVHFQGEKENALPPAFDEFLDRCLGVAGGDEVDADGTKVE